MGEQVTPTVTIGIDVGGTFTDIVVSSRRDGRIAIDKVLSTPGRLWVGIMEGLRKVIGDDTLDETLTAARIIHATTQATNAIIESKTARVALITNRGFRDVLEIRRHYRTRLYDINMKLPPCLVPRDLRLEIDARLDFRGNELVAVDPKQVAELARWARSQGVEGYAVCLLHAYVDPKQEQVVADALRAAHPGAFITCSSSVCPEYREYERTSTTVVNAAVMPIVDTYLERLEDELQGRGYSRDLYIMQSNGGMMTARDIRLRPVNIIESGPAAGVIAAVAIGRQIGRPNVLSFDMGGTTAKAALIHQGQIEMTTEYEVGTGSDGHGVEKQEGYALRVPVMEIAEVGTGGGSIAWIDSGGALRVGPRSAGAVPGPVCYGHGGIEPTTTDANLVLGALGSEYFLGGEMELDVEGARRAVADKIGKPLGLGLMEAAAGIIELSNAVMVRALKRVSVEKGRLPSDYVLVAFGGAGPLQAAYLADDLDMHEVIVPPFPGVASAVGLLDSDIRYEYVQAYFGQLLSLDPQEITKILEALAERGRQDLARSGISADAMEFLPSADLRYIGQAYEIRVDWPGLRVGAADLAAMQERFHGEHQRLYSFATPDRAIESVSLRLTAAAAVDRLDPRVPLIGSGRPTPKGRREVYMRRTGRTETPVYERTELKFGQWIEGPAIIEQKDSTTLVVPGWRAESDQHGNLRLTRRDRSQRASA